VIGYSEILLEDAQIEAQEEHIADLRRINSAGNHLLSLVTDVLDMSAIEADKMELAVSPFELVDFIEDVVSTSRSLVTANNNEFAVERIGDLGLVMSDPTRLRQATLNLLSNAGKFTKNGKVTLSVAREKMASVDWIKISVKDTGIGISQDNLGKLFRDFNQAEASTEARYGGTGLGLALSQKLCAVMGGAITVDSEPGRGSCFTIRVPAFIDAAVPPTVVEPAAAELQAQAA
jgi:signal transduction histidine kinase